MKRWIRKDLGPVTTIDTSKTSILYPWNTEQGIRKTPARLDLRVSRPSIRGAKYYRVAKDMVYRDTILEHIQTSGSTGIYLGLAAAYTPEIFSLVYPYIDEIFINVNNDHCDYNLLKVQNTKISKAYEDYEIDFRVVYDDIITYMNNWIMEDVVGFLDLDIMCHLNKDNVTTISAGLNKCLTNRAVVSLWHGPCRKQGKGWLWFEKIVKPELFRAIECNFKIVAQNEVSYYEDQLADHTGYPMRVHVLTLERKSKRE